MLVPLVSEDYEVLLLAFCGFEALLGVYWPAIALLRSSELSDAQRSSTMSVFRSLLNLLVIGVLLLVGLYTSVEPYLVSGAIASMAGVD